MMVYRVASLGVTGALTSPLLVNAVVALPGVFIGAWVAAKIFDRVPEALLGWIVLALLTINAAILLSSSIPEL